MPDPILPPPQQPGAPVPWLELLRSILFWLVFLTVVILAFRHYLRVQGVNLWLGRTSWLAWMQGWARWLRSLFRRAGEGMDRAVRKLQRQAAQTGQVLLESLSNPLTRSDLLPPRQQVLVTYLTMVAWMSTRGMRRKASDTPSDFAKTLRQAAPSAGDAVEQLTTLFEKARYSRQEISVEESQIMRSEWQYYRQAVLSSDAVEPID